MNATTILTEGDTELPPNRTFGAAMSWMCGGQQIPVTLFPGALSLRILKLLFVRPSD